MLRRFLLAARMTNVNKNKLHIIDNRIYNSRLNTPHQLRRRKCPRFSLDKNRDTSKDGLLLGAGIRHIIATQVEVKKFLLAYVILF